MRAIFGLAALAAILAGCGNRDIGDGGEGIAAVEPSRIDAAALREAADDPRVRAFYAARAWQPAWTEETARALVEAIGGAERHALNPAHFLAEAERAADPAAREAGLSLAALSYAQALARGRTEPTRVGDVYSVPRPNPDLAAGLNRALERNSLADWLESLAPQDDEYRLLSEAYLHYSRRAGRERRTPVPAGALIRPGRSDPRIPQIAQALRAEGRLPAPPQPRGQQPAAPDRRYAPELVAAVRRLQQDFGLEPTGNIGPDTLAALNGGAFDRARALAVNLERRRWLDRRPPATRIDVNTAAATLGYWRDGRLADRRRVVVGQPGNETPELGSPLFRLVANPTWTVPESIADEEILPKGAGYMARNRMSLQNGRIVQESGPENSLGLVKFDMRNDQAIYLHDTPAKALFGQEQRHHSHGCVRVEDALGFAGMIAEQEGVLDQWQRAQATQEETFVPLPREIPVRLMYHSAFVDGGRVVFRPDAYGWDDDVARALGLAAGPRRTAPTHIPDIGP